MPNHDTLYAIIHIAWDRMIISRKTSKRTTTTSDARDTSCGNAGVALPFQ